MRAASRLRRKQSDLTDSDSQRERQMSPVGKALSGAASQRVIPDIRLSGHGLDHLMPPSSATNSDQEDSDHSDCSQREDLDSDDGAHTTRSTAASTSRQTLFSRFSQPNLRHNGHFDADNGGNASDAQRGYRRQRKVSVPSVSSRECGPPSQDSARDSDDNRSIEAVRNDLNHRRLERQMATDPSSQSFQTDSESEEQGWLASSYERIGSARSIRRSISRPEMDDARSAAGSSSESATIVSSTSRRPSANPSARTRVQTSVSTILRSARDATPKTTSLSSTKSRGVQKSSSSGLNNSATSVRSSKTSRSTHITPQRATVRNARGEIEWKDAPPMPNVDFVHQTQHMSLQPPERLFARSRSRGTNHDQRASSRSPGYTSSDQDYYSPTSPSPTKVPFRALGAASKGHANRPSLQRHASEESGGYHTANDDDVEAREWERMRERQMEMDRFDVYQQQQHREEELRIARRRAERERANAEMRERERVAAERRKADRTARRLAREKAEQEEVERRERELAEAEARRRKEKEEARLRKIQAQKEAEESRLRKEQEAKERELQEKKEAEERAIREKKEADERAIREKKEAEERRIREQKEAEERQIREAEEAQRKAEEEIVRKEAERLAAIEAERLAKEAAIQAAKDAIIEKARQLAEARRQVVEEDKAARRTGRRDEKRAQRALNSALPEGQTAAEDEPISDDESSLELFDDGHANTGVVRNSSAGSRDVKSSTDGSVSNPEARSSTDGSADMPATPADDRSFSLGQHVSAEMQIAQSADSIGEGQLKYQTLTNGESTPTGLPARLAPYKHDRFRIAVQGGARRTLPTLVTPQAARIAHPTEATISEAIVQPDGPYREGGITYGRGWCAHGLADPSLVVDRRRYVRLPAYGSSSEAAGVAAATETQNVTTRAINSGTERAYEEVMYSDLGELIWIATTPDVIVRLISHLDYPDIKALRQTSQSIRFALGQLGGREIVLSRFLAPIGYQAWKPATTTTDADSPSIGEDPMPLTFSDCEDFLLSFELVSEYRLVGAEFARAAHKMDPRYPRLARATTRAYNRVLTRLRMQPDFRVPTSAVRQDSLPVSPLVQQASMLPSVEHSSVSMVEDSKSTSVHSLASITSPWKPGRAGYFRAWVPSTEVGGWLSDVELARCERELFIAGVWPHLKKGDVVWDCAIGDERNEGKYIFDGRYLRDLSFMFDRVGHLPSWLNSFTLVPSYYHNIVQSGDPSQPVVYLDVLPWRDQIVSTMRLVQDQVETLSPQGARYRISKWLYRAVVNITSGQVISEEGVDLTDRGWHGRLVIETEGTAEHAKELISRCAGPSEGERTKARLLASVMDSTSVSKGIPKAPAPVKDAKGQQIDTTSPWAIVRARSRPGLIWIRPLDARDRVVF